MRIKSILSSIFLWMLTIPLVLWYVMRAIILDKRKRFTTSIATRYFHQMSQSMLRIVGASYQVSVKQPIHFDSSRIYLFMSNHLANYDFPLILATMPGHVRFIAKKELLEMPLGGKTLKSCDYFFIDRQNPQSAAETFLNIKKMSLAKNLRLWVFPEGTRSRTGELLPLKAGIFRLAQELEAIIIPVGIWGTQNILPAGQWLFNQRGQKVSIHVGEPIDSRNFNRRELPKLLQTVEQSIIALTKIAKDSKK